MIKKYHFGGFDYHGTCERITSDGSIKKDPIVRLGLKEGLPGSKRDGRLKRLKTAKAEKQYSFF